MEQSNFEQFIELLNQKGIIRKMQVTKQMMIKIADNELQRAIDQASIASMIIDSTKKDANLKKAYDCAANEMMIDKIMEVVNSTKDVQFTPQEMFAKGISEALLGDVFKELDDIQKNIMEQIRKVKGEENE